jgi:hypothetical protein
MLRQNGRLRFALVVWMYLIAAAHIAAGLVFAFLFKSAYLANYHQQVLQAFGVTTEPSVAVEIHLWWLRLFGATLQNLGWLMMALVFVGNKYRNANLWLWMLVGLLLWAPQDMWISLRVHLWMHVWADCVALGLLMPPLLILWRIDLSFDSTE